MSTENQNKSKAWIRLIKRIILGKEKPPIIIRALAWFTMVWSFILAAMSGLLAVYSLLHADRMDKAGDIKGLGFDFFISYTILHLLALFSGILLYRRKKSGFYLFAVCSILISVLPYTMISGVGFEPLMLVFGLVFLGLWATQLKKLS